MFNGFRRDVNGLPLALAETPKNESKVRLGITHLPEIEDKMPQEIPQVATLQRSYLFPKRHF